VQIALNDAGAVSFAWRSNSTSNNVVTRSPDGTWSGVTKLSANAAGIDTAIDRAGNAIVAFAVTQWIFAVTQWSTNTLTYASLRPTGGTWGVPTLLSGPNDKGGVCVAGDPAGTFVVSWNDSAGNVEAATSSPGGGFGPSTPVGAAPTRQLIVIPGKAVLWTAAGISTKPVN
jgi:hypothetical protein